MHPVCFLWIICTISLVNAFSSSLPGRVNVIHNPLYRSHRPSRYVRTLLKYKITPTHPDALQVHEIISRDGRILREDVTLGLVAADFLQAEGFYLSPLTIGEGSQAKTFILDVDTGSPDLWVFSTLLSPDQRGIHNLYDPINSNSSVRPSTPFGGFKQSGFGRELGMHAMDGYSELKNVFYSTG